MNVQNNTFLPSYRQQEIPHAGKFSSLSASLPCYAVWAEYSEDDRSRPGEVCRPLLTSESPGASFPDPASEYVSQASSPKQTTYQLLSEIPQTPHKPAVKAIQNDSNSPWSHESWTGLSCECRSIWEASLFPSVCNPLAVAPVWIKFINDNI